MNQRNYDIRLETRSKALPENGWWGSLKIILPGKKPLLWTLEIPGELADAAALSWCRAVNSCANMQQAIVSGNQPAANYHAWQTHDYVGQSAEQIAQVASSLMPLIREGLPMVTSAIRDIGTGLGDLFKGGPDPTRAPAPQLTPEQQTGGVTGFQERLAAAMEAGARQAIENAEQGVSGPEAQQRIQAAANAAVAQKTREQQAGYAASKGLAPGGPSSLPGAGLSLYGAGAGTAPRPGAAATLGTGELLKTALDTASNSPQMFGALAPEVANLLSTSLSLYDRAVLSKLGRGDYHGAIEQAHYDTSRKVANALRIAQSLLEV